MYMRLAGSPPWLVLTMVFDFLAAAFFAFYIPTLLSFWMWGESSMAFVIVFFFAIAWYDIRSLLRCITDTN